VKGDEASAPSDTLHYPDTQRCVRAISVRGMRPTRQHASPRFALQRRKAGVPMQDAGNDGNFSAKMALH